LELPVDEEIAEVIQKHGWFVASISDHETPFLYTIGLMQTVNHPEFIIFGLEADNANTLFSQLVHEIRTGRSYAEPGVYAVSIGGDEHRVGFRTVHPSQHELYLGFAMGYCRHIGRWGELQAVQAFWPDCNGKFPFEIGCDLAVYQLQPRLDTGLTKQELRRWRRQWE
jgi:hypothetical protein